MTEKTHVEVSGMGAITPVGTGIAAFSESLRFGVSNFATLSLSHEGQSFSYPIGQVNSFALLSAMQGLDLNTEISARVKRLRNITTSSSFGIYCALEAWADAGLQLGNYDPARIAIVSGGSNTQQAACYDIHQKYQKKLRFINPNYGLNFFDSDLVGILSEVLGIVGEGYTIASASASGGMAIIQGHRLIASDAYDIVLVVAPLMDLSIFEYQGLTAIGAMAISDGTSPELICRPFDSSHRGFVFGQNAGCLILESQKHRSKRKEKIYATIPAYGVSLDGNRNPNPSEEGETRAITNAIAAAGLTAAHIDYVNAHGTSSALGDNTEVRALCNAQLTYSKVNSTKSIVGHGLSAAGLVEAIATIIQMNEGFIHANKNLDDPITDQINWAGLQSQKAHINYAITNSFGFGGVNTAVVLKNCYT